jgi:hypothetical protein
VNLLALDQHIAHLALIDFGQELRERNILRGLALAGILEQRE